MTKRRGRNRPSARASDAYDSPWKDGITTFFKPFLALFFPHVHDEIDWTAGVEHLDVELRQVIRDAELSEQRADKLVKVRRLDGSEHFLAPHGLRLGRLGMQDGHRVSGGQADGLQ